MVVNLNDPEFLKRAAKVRQDLEDGEQMTLDEIAAALGMPFEQLALHLVGEFFRQDPSLDGAMIEGEFIPRVAQ